MSVATELLFLGLPDAGKTTFFVALDEVLERQSDVHGLKSGGFANDRTYIDEAKKEWRAGRKVPRTHVDTHEAVELHVIHPSSSQTTHIIAPDVGGEFFENQWADRQLPVEYKIKLGKISGIFLFLNVKFASRSEEISPGAIDALKVEEPQNEKNSPKPWEARFASTQVKLVDLLQFTANAINSRNPIPLAVMMSAWDVVDSAENPKDNPRAFLATNWALLDQYLKANTDLYTSKIYGVSARGGDGDSVPSKLLRLPPHKRVWLNDDGQITRDITAPLRWLLKWE